MKSIIILLSVFVLTSCATTGDVVTTVEPPGHQLTESDSATAIGQDNASSLVNDVSLSPPANLWDLIEANYQFDPQFYHHQRVEKQIDFLLARHQLIDSISTRAEPFLYYIYEQIKLRDLPMELALLPAVESTYDPYAYSPAGASGLWQFIRRTGDSFGLVDDWWQSRRRDIEASTQAALDYLEDLYGYYDSWELALAAYNAGIYRVDRAIAYNHKRGLPTDYWHLHLPRETLHYVPRLIAYSRLFSHSYRDELGIAAIAAKPYWTKVSLPYQISFAELINQADLDEDEFFVLNAEHNQWLSSPHKDSLIVPIADARRVEEAIASYAANNETQWLGYQVQQQDEVKDIAERFGISHHEITQFNDVEKIRSGNYIILPLAGEQAEQTEQTTDPTGFELPQTIKRQNKYLYHVVRYGDTLWDISRSYGVSIQQLAQWNQLKSTRIIYPGQKLVVGKGVSVAEPAIYLADDYNRKVMRSVHYRVRRGDSLHLIADKFNISINELMEWNTSKAKAKHIYPGQSIRLYLDVTDL